MNNPGVIENAKLTMILSKAANIEGVSSRKKYVNEEIVKLSKQCSPAMRGYILKRLALFNTRIVLKEGGLRYDR